MVRAASLLSIFILFAISITALISIDYVYAATSDSYTFPVNSAPYNISYKDWTAKWWQWYISIPKNHNGNFQHAPDAHYTPVDCSYLQRPSSPVFFVPYVGKERGPSTTASCVIPHGKAILVRIDGGESDYSDPTVHPKTQDELLKLVAESNLYPNPFNVMLDGQPLSITNGQSDLVTTNPFNYTMPQNNLWNEPPGPDQGIGQGWYVFLKPLAPGTHNLQYDTGYMRIGDPRLPPGQGNDSPYIQHVTYNLVIK
jgi:hypothetical protein